MILVQIITAPASGSPLATPWQNDGGAVGVAKCWRLPAAPPAQTTLTSGRAWVQFCLYDASGAYTQAQRFVRVA